MSIEIDYGYVNEGPVSVEEAVAAVVGFDPSAFELEERTPLWPLALALAVFWIVAIKWGVS